MSEIKNIHLWRCDLTLHDYLFFATAKRSHVSETGRFIHNYALTYALNWVRSEWYTMKQEPKYKKQLTGIEGIYVTPASLLRGSYISMSYRTETEDYSLSANTDSNGINCGSLKCFRPGSVFRFYLLSRSYLDKIPSLVRLGRSMAKAGIATQYPLELEIAEGDYIASSLLNWDDMAVKPRLCDVIVYALPGRLIENARFAGNRYLTAIFADGKEIKLPLEMGYCRAELCSSWWENAA